MELERQRPPAQKAVAVQTQRLVDPEKWPESVLKVLELFKGIKVPRSDPQKHQSTKPTATTPDQQQDQLVPLSINGYQATALGRGCYALLSMPVSEHHMQAYISNVHERLVDELRQCFRLERCRDPELFMVSDAAGNVGPCIVLSVWDDLLCRTKADQRKLVKRAAKKVEHLQTLKKCPFPIKVIADTINLSARVKPECLEVLAQQELRSELRSLVSFGVNTEANKRNFRLGGVVYAGPKSFGLTCLHPFVRGPGKVEPDAPPSEQDNQSISSSEMSEGDSDDDEAPEHLFKPGQYSFVATVVHGPPARPVDTVLSTIIEGMGSQQAQHLPLTTRSSAEPIQSTMTKVRKVGHLDFDPSKLRPGEQIVTSEFADATYDWALIELEPGLSALPNMYRREGDDTAIHVSTFSEELPKQGTEVTILATSRTHLTGFIGQGNLAMDIDGWPLLVTQILLEKPLGACKLPITTVEHRY
jgi:hypothetical protein